MDNNKKFSYLEHMTDAIVEAYGKDMKEAFANASLGLLNLMFNISKVKLEKEVKITVVGNDPYNLLYEWLEKILLLVYIDNFIVTNFKFKIFRCETNSEVVKETSENNENKDLDSNFQQYYIECIVAGEEIDLIKHEYKLEVKSITYHEMEIKHKESYYVKFLVDL
ncbi:MAG: archease [Nitrososphaeraceae archaeon]